MWKFVQGALLLGATSACCSRRFQDCQTLYSYYVICPNVDLQAKKVWRCTFIGMSVPSQCKRRFETSMYACSSAAWMRNVLLIITCFASMLDKGLCLLLRDKGLCLLLRDKGLCLLLRDKGLCLLLTVRRHTVIAKIFFIEGMINLFVHLPPPPALKQIPLDFYIWCGTTSFPQKPASSPDIS